MNLLKYYYLFWSYLKFVFSYHFLVRLFCLNKKIKHKIIIPLLYGVLFLLKSKNNFCSI